ncbi:MULTISPECIES: mandelate racemase/muconate lactonizing enzyme family protein [unclassified Sporosarcina]|uniref:mandelate racemase/muconate lactonizing enzyme family protein n=1 Tax=unclassified Sporosarcina TaxID=2647733 RepID=UPI00203E88B9|nr:MULTISPECIES: dipeptide epimerase [unclassified Sporosarcina]GKV63856.1 L-Ala-D/L-Glu epimerase [Sporosarcina sp. NCCP-2331]GLB54635.1 L-Ala-D/L-Glu epimerase [Sporosarcina sp. NCCP-2378]
MNIRTVETFVVQSKLKKPFVTALRTVFNVQSIIVKMTTESGLTGWGEAVPAHVITGETVGSIRYAIERVLAPVLIGENVVRREVLFEKVQRSLLGNSSAKAAVDMAVHDIFAQHCGLPLMQMLGGYSDRLTTDLTVSAGAPKEMVKEAAEHTAKGFSVLKIKIGTGNFQEERVRIRTIRQEVGPDIVLRLDANQGWKPKEAIRVIRQFEDDGLDIELVEQPVAANDLEGLREVTMHTETLIMADESLFSIGDARKLLEMRAADLLNIKLMKSGGIHEALKINAMAQSYGVECMAGSMMETAVGVTAAAHFAASQPNITRTDLDAPLLLAGVFDCGGIVYKGSVMEFAGGLGLGFDSERMKQWVKEYANE